MVSHRSELDSILLVNLLVRYLIRDSPVSIGAENVMNLIKN